MVRVSYEQKPYRRSLMQAFGATVTPSPSDRTNAGRAGLERDPDSPGSLGLAIAEAVEVAATSGGRTKYSLGSVLNHVLMHQTVIGIEALEQLEMAGEYPDVVVGCVGGGSNFAGFVLPFVRNNLTERKPASSRSSRRPLRASRREVRLRLRGHGDDHAPHQDAHARPFVHPRAGPRRRAALPRDGADRLRAARPPPDRGGGGPAEPVFEALTFARSEAIIPAPEAAHAIRGAIDEALACKETGEEKVIAFNLCGHGHFDMAAYDDYLAGKLPDFEYSDAEVGEALAELPG